MQKFKTVIEPKNKLLDLKLKETFSYKDLIFLMVKRDFVAKYKQTLLGPLWAIIQPLFTTLVFTIVFGTLAQLSTFDTKEIAGMPSFLFFMAGNICWAYFSATTSGTSSTFLANAGIMGKVYYPRLVSPIATIFSNLISFGIQLAIFLVVWIFYLIKGSTGMAITPWLLMAPLVLLQLMLFSLGLGIIISSLTTKYRDLQMAVGFGLTLLQYASPIAYGLTYITNNNAGKWRVPIYLANPITNAITTFRYAFFGTGYFSLLYYLIGWGITLAVLFIGLLLFNKTERTFMDTI